ncbi:flagellar biosynthetic protein FliP [Gilliamella sp. Occ3-1]|uniref:flagellar type III secretion system pore protein FliP n=1 Tax=Gilliamella sp. Occ3-1 TaxID=3120253 RepID=UPI00080ECB48|nr:flagellar type III secretion system pore protein FliP [Gilliamella apicola]OCG72160.1 flagellar biosynthetic protein FliP [Gilliamella apicola]
MRLNLTILLSLLLFSLSSHAETSALTNINQPLTGGQNWSLPVETLVFLTLLTFIPAILLLMTSFTRIIIVLGLLRNALGTQSAPPNQVILGISLFMTFFIMSPVIDKIYQEAYVPYSQNQITMQEGLTKATKPLQEFMLTQTRENDLALFVNMSHQNDIQTREDVPLKVLVPAFVVSELKTAFQIGFTIFIPFLVIDLVVASTLMALGMMMVPPATVSLPFKLMLFVLADGWHLLLGSLAQSFFS